ncbi:DUF2958 domain-containing protein, partial [Bathymodiolus thermophilus thioautotrophic gill symbiont]
MLLEKEKTTQQKLKKIKPFLPKQQYSVVSSDVDGSEYEFKDVVNRLFKAISTMPEVYDPTEKDKDEGKDEDEDTIAYLHYFQGGSDWFITKKASDENQRLAFGYAVLNDDLEMAELGYISIEELKGLNIDLDFHFEPATLGRIQRNLNERCHVVDVAEKEVKPNANELSLTQFVNDFGEGLLERVAEQA